MDNIDWGFGDYPQYVCMFAVVLLGEDPAARDRYWLNATREEKDRYLKMANALYNLILEIGEQDKWNR